MASLDDEIDRLESVSTFELRTLWRRHWKKPPPMRLSKDMMIRGLSYRLQEVMLGGIGKIEQRKLAVLANDPAYAVRDEGSPHVANASGIGETDPSQKMQCRRKSMSVAAPTLVLREGNRLVREWNGTTHTVLVLDSGFEWQGRQYRSLSQIAEAITGAHWSGPRFFGLTKRASQGIGRPAVDRGFPSPPPNGVSTKAKPIEGTPR